jgi:hypothetical protein
MGLFDPLFSYQTFSSFGTDGINLEFDWLLSLLNGLHFLQEFLFIYLSFIRNQQLLKLYLHFSLS